MQQLEPAPSTLASQAPSAPSNWWLWWWGALCTLSLFNVIWLVVEMRQSSKREASLRTTNSKIYLQRLRHLAAIFVVVCAWRSVLPNIYLFRMVLWDTPLSSILVARLLATVAEVCWMTQLSLVLARVNDDIAAVDGQATNGHLFVFAVSRFILVAIPCAEVFSCIGTVTTNSLWFMLEEGSWVVTMTAVLPCAAFLVYRIHNQRCWLWNSSIRIFSTTLLVLTLGYVPWGWSSDVTANFNRWQSELQSNTTTFFNFSAGVVDALETRHLERGLDHWRPYLLWLSAYMSAGVWTSILMVKAPMDEEAESFGKGMSNGQYGTLE